MTAVVITYDGATPTVGSDEDTWGAELNTNALAKIKADLDALALTPANSIKGNNTGSAQGVDDLTVTQVTAMLNTVVGDSGSGGTKGLVTAPAAGDAAARKFLMADGTWVADERKAWAVVTGATGAVVAGRNIAITRNSAGSYAVTFSTALASANYAVFWGFQTGSPDIFGSVGPAGKSASGFTFSVVTAAAVDTDPTEFYLQVLAA